METKTFYNEVLTDHNMHPYHKHDIDNADLELEGDVYKRQVHMWRMAR